MNSFTQTLATQTNTTQSRITAFSRVKSFLPFKKNNVKKVILTLNKLTSKGSKLNPTKLFSYAQDRSSVTTLVPLSDKSGNPVNLLSAQKKFDPLFALASEEIHHADDSDGTSYCERDEELAEAVQKVRAYYAEALLDSEDDLLQKHYQEGVCRLDKNLKPTYP